MIREETFKIGIFGSAAGDDIDRCRQLAFDIGREVALNDGILCTGACPGLPHEAALGVKSERGPVLGFSPAMNFTDHVVNFKFPGDPYYIFIFTGMEKKGRNLICTRTCNAGIFISGRYGTLNEFTLMYDEGESKVIGLLKGSGGFVDNLIIPSLGTTEKPSKARIVLESNPGTLVRKVFEELNACGNKGEGGAS